MFWPWTKKWLKWCIVVNRRNNIQKYQRRVIFDVGLYRQHVQICSSELSRKWKRKKTLAPFSTTCVEQRLAGWRASIKEDYGLLYCVVHYNFAQIPTVTYKFHLHCKWSFAHPTCIIYIFFLFKQQKVLEQSMAFCVWYLQCNIGLENNCRC